MVGDVAIPITLALLYDPLFSIISGLSASDYPVTVTLQDYVMIIG